MFLPAITSPFGLQFCWMMAVHSAWTSGTSKFSKRDIALLMSWSLSWWSSWISALPSFWVFSLLSMASYSRIFVYLRIVPTPLHMKWVIYSEHVDVALYWLLSAIVEVLHFLLVNDFDGQTRSPFITVWRCGRRRNDAQRGVKIWALYCVSLMGVHCTG